MPYGGDIQAAMRAQDREAIKTIMALRRQQQQQPTEEVVPSVEGGEKAKEADAEEEEREEGSALPPFVLTKVQLPLMAMYGGENEDGGEEGSAEAMQEWRETVLHVLMETFPQHELDEALGHEENKASIFRMGSSGRSMALGALSLLRQTSGGRKAGGRGLDLEATNDTLQVDLLARPGKLLWLAVGLVNALLWQEKRGCVTEEQKHTLMGLVRDRKLRRACEYLIRSYQQD
jgi:hypothetical protein